ncbi:MAG: 4'-phosphopantetheinyl transferase superfamily protein, partial [Actinomycetota bacterium]|nr:4'-phosphopantetheinyl transferase superfamily protein [Actinomycetota bacterium]
MSRPSIARPEHGQAHVWWAGRRDASPALERLLDADERTRLSAYRRGEDRQRFLVGCALAKTVLGGYRDLRPEEVRFSRTCPRCGKPHGKPQLPDADGCELELSISHSGEVVAVAVAPGASVGIDVEELILRPRMEELVSTALSARETRQLSDLSPGERERGFLVYWTRKEAVAKAAGLGLAVSPDKIVVSGPVEPPQLLSWPVDDRPARVTLFDLRPQGGGAAALAVIGPCRAVTERDGSRVVRGATRHRARAT